MYYYYETENGQFANGVKIRKRTTMEHCIYNELVYLLRYFISTRTAMVLYASIGVSVCARRICIDLSTLLST